jgi:hypothetical protein
MTAMNLAQLNIATPRYPTDDPRMSDFMVALDRINAVADASPGFVWRLVGEDSNDATDLRAQHGDREVMVNMSVWTDRDALRAYVYRSEHLDFLRRRTEWFDAPDGEFMVLWWVPDGHIPTVDEAIARLETLSRNGPTPEAFTFRHHFDAQNLATTQ